MDLMAAFYLGGNMKCSKCDTKNRDDAEVCRRCGQRLIKSEPTEKNNFSYDSKPLIFTIIIMAILIIIVKVIFKM